LKGIPVRTILLILCVLALAWAEDGAAAKAQQGAIAKLLLSTAPEQAMSVSELRNAGLQPGSRVTVRAQIGGRNPPWLPSHAMMLLADAKELQACSAGGCGAPWDFCSAPRDKLLQHTGLVRWLDETGTQPRAVPFTEIAAIAPLATVIVTGTLADIGDPRALVIDLDGIFLEDRGPFAHLMEPRPN
jgi:hypothetical protein